MDEAFVVSVVEDHSLQSLSLLHHVQFGSFFAPSASIIADVDGGSGGGAKDDAIILIENRLQGREKKRLQVRSLSLPHSLIHSRGAFWEYSEQRKGKIR